MFTAEEARAMTKYAIDHMRNHYFNEYRAKANKAIQTAVEDGSYVASFSFKILDGAFKEDQYNALNRLAVTLENDYGYKVTVKDSRPSSLMKLYYSQIYVTINWQEDEDV